ncbi:MAG: phosphotransferase family protein [Cyclobacteriaceae bacterium]|jgi:aminoglycoside phosphotransferase (APT) family kinase protein|nr:phosphotransferase family protein [Cyclobacteriaceae bacterium]
MNSLSSDQPGEAREREAPSLTALNEYLTQHAPHLGEIQSITQFPSGYSNLTFCLTTTAGDYILRRPPMGANIKSAHDMSREFAVLSKLKPVYCKVPTPLLYADDASVIGAPFYIMERLQGIILRASNAPQLAIREDVYRQLSTALIDNLVNIHAIDIHSSGLAELGKPEGYVQRQVEGWIKRYYAAETDSLEWMNQLAEWLSKHMPESGEPAFLHNDYKYDNVVLSAKNLTDIIGVLDWEMATVGDPLMDLGACLAYWSEAGDHPILQSFNLTSLPGNLTRKEVVERYAVQSGREVRGILFYYVFGLFKNAVIAQQIYARWKQGYSTDVRFGGLMQVIKALSQKGINCLETQTI